MKKLNGSSVWQPNYIVDSVLSLDIAELQRIGVTHLVFDLDNTLVARRANTLTPKHLQQVAALKQAGFTVLLGSNTRRDVSSITNLLDVVAVPSTLVSIKPFRSFYRRVIVAADTTPEHIAMIGDHMLNDVMGANRAGLCSILVKSLAGRRSLVNHTYLWVLRKYQKSS